MKKIFLALYLTTALVAEVVQPFKVRYQKNINGNIAVIGNTLMTAPKALFTNGQPPLEHSNDKINMRFITIDKTKKSSSSATLSLKEGSKVLYAALYWGARSTKSNKIKGKIQFKSPLSKYVTIKADKVYSVKKNAYYSAVANVTKRVKKAGSGEYTVANIEAMTGKDTFGGWSLVVIYENENLPLRSMTLFDGYAIVPPSVNITVQGFKTPKKGKFSAYLNTISFEGDYENSGDGLVLNGYYLEDTLNPRDNFFNSQITQNGKLVTAKNPNYTNQLGLDIKQIDITGLIKNASTKAAIKFETSKDFYQPVALTFVTDYDTGLAHTQKLLSTGVKKHGDVVTFVSKVTNKVSRSAYHLNFKNKLPKGLVYVKNSLRIANKPVKARYIHNTIETIIPKIKGKKSVLVSFKARLQNAPVLPYAVVLNNQAIVTNHIKSLGLTISIPSDNNASMPDIQATALHVEEAPETLGVEQKTNSFAHTSVNRGESILFATTLHNPSEKTASTMGINITVPDEFTVDKNSITQNSKPIQYTLKDHILAIKLNALKAKSNTTIHYRLTVKPNKQAVLAKQYNVKQKLTYNVDYSPKKVIKTVDQNIHVNELLAFTKAKKAFYEGNFSKAESSFDTLFFEHMGSTQINHYLARSAYEAKEFDTSLAAYDRLLIMDEFNPEYNLEVATLYVDTKAYANATGILTALKELNTTQEKRKKNLLQRISDARDRHTFIALTNLSIGYDTNVDSSASTETLKGYYENELNTTPPTSATAPQGDLYASAMANLISIYDIGDKSAFFLQNMLTVLSKNYVSLTDFNMIYAKLSSAIGYDGGSFKVMVPFEGDHVIFAGKNLVQSVGASPSLTLKHTKSYSSAYTIKYQRKRYVNRVLNRLKDTNNLVIDAKINYKDGTNSVSLAYKAQNASKAYSISTVQYISYFANNFTASYGIKLPFNLNFSSRLLFRKVFYSDKVIQTTNLRSDDQASLNLTLKQQILPKLTVGVQYTFNNNYSNFAPLINQKQTIQATLDYRF